MIFGKRENIKKLSDLELVERYRKTSNNRYVGELYERYGHLVFGSCLKYLENEAESRDAVLNIFEKLLTDLHKHEVKSFRSWIYMVARNHCLMFLREQKAARKREERYRNEVINDPEDEETDPHKRELDLDRLEDAMKTLKEEQRVCVDLFYLKEKCYQEISEMTGFTPKQVKSYIQNGKRNLRLKLSKENESIQTS